jgi:hypothetical protein
MDPIPILNVCSQCQELFRKSYASLGKTQVKCASFHFVYLLEKHREKDDERTVNNNTSSRQNDASR